MALHQHNEREASAAVIARLAAGQRVAYVSDAGTPAISDPGAVLVATVQAAGFTTVAIPGASSAIAALSVSGDTAGATSGAGFTFTGFLPSKGGERATALQALADSSATQVLFEAPHRIEALVASLAQACGPRKVTLCRELTKQFETVATMPADALPAWLTADANRLRGEFVLVVHAKAVVVDADEAAQHDRTLKTLLADLPLKQAVALAAELTGAPRNALYARALSLKQAAEG